MTPATAEAENQTKPEETEAGTGVEQFDENGDGGLFLLGDYDVADKVQSRAPDGSVLKLKGAKIDLGQSQFARGTRLVLAQTVQVTGDDDEDTIDTLSGEVKSTSKAQKATICLSARLEEYLAAKIEDDKLLAQVCVEIGLPMPERLQAKA